MQNLIRTWHSEFFTDIADCQQIQPQNSTITHKMVLTTHRFSSWPVVLIEDNVQNNTEGCKTVVSNCYDVAVSWILKMNCIFKLNGGRPATSETLVICSRYTHIHNLKLHTLCTDVSLESSAHILLSLSFVWTDVLQTSHSQWIHVDFILRWSAHVKNQYPCSLWDGSMVKQSCIFYYPPSRRNNDHRANSDLSETILTSSCAN